MRCGDDNHEICLNFWKLLNLAPLKAVEHLAIVILFLDIESVM